MIGMDIYRVLSSEPSITDIVGNRIYPVNGRETDIPCIIYEVGSPVIEETYDEGAVQLASINFTVSCVAKTYAESQTLYNNVMKLMVDYADPDDGRIQRVMYDGTVNEDNYIDPELDNVAWYDVVISFRAWFYWK